MAVEVENNENTADTKPAGWRDRAVPIAGALGTGLVAGGTLLALYSRYFATTWPLDDDRISGGRVFGDKEWIDISRLPGTFGTAAWVVGLLVLAVAAAVVWASRDGDYDGWGPAVALAGAAGLFTFPFLAVKYVLPTAYRELRTEHPWFAALPTAIAAGILVTLGSVLVLRLAWEPAKLELLPRRMLALTAAVGLLVSGAVAFVAGATGDDRRNVDHLTATRSETPTVPAGLGAEQYRISLPAQATGWNGATYGDIVPAGNGFVVSSSAGLTAYDGRTGAPRWHYLRKTGDGRPDIGYISKSLRAAAGGTVVIAEWSELGWYAFDAVTGEILWKNSDFGAHAVDYEDPTRIPRADTAALILFFEDGLQGYDPRTGKHLWTTTTATSDCLQGRTSMLDTDTAIYLLLHCRNRSEIWSVAMTLDTTNGAVLGSREVARTTIADKDSRYVHLASSAVGVSIAWNKPAAGMIVLGRPDEVTSAPVLDRFDAIVAIDPGNTDALAQDWVRGADEGYHRLFVLDRHTGAERYELPGTQDYVGKGEAALLETEIVLVDYALSRDQRKGGFELRSWSRTDGQPIRTLPIAGAEKDCGSAGLIPAPGTLLTYCGTADSLELTGFAAG
ncbi:PQQ-binding-like beta-propeller repeat protein [Nocardia huaxiensis]|uniref:outer membrane protein assembly factor BamB family protein n=1 Tax=Nocardia huaxiensis TaxID=2755382 RepID=UPI001E3E4E30|nr:PQQ-binding-like beta-propeller repeat protein [Nocardia huaxiensis]UFS96702.1 PQQ-like beta-propeller repeat protein [Nocardia huaxiensis]